MYVLRGQNKLYLNKYNVNSGYITYEELSSMHQEIKQSVSLIRFNCRSVKSNFDNIDCLLHRCRSEFSIIGLSETWMNDVKGDDYDMYDMKGYTVHYVNRKKIRKEVKPLYFLKILFNNIV